MSKIKATAQFKLRLNGKLRANVPAEVRDRFNAQSGDRLIFEEGGFIVAERAATRGAYFVVWLERAKTETELEVSGQIFNTSMEISVPLESFAEAVERKQQEPNRGIVK